MNILQLLDEPWDSGITAYALQISELLRNAGHNVSVGVRPGVNPEKAARDKGLPTKNICSLMDIRRAVLGTPWDIINAHTGRSHTWAVGWNVMYRRQCPVVRTRGDARPLRVNFLTHMLYRRTAAVIAASDHIGRQFEEGFGMGQTRVNTIYPSVPADKPMTFNECATVGILGRLDPVKGHTVFLEAAALVLRDFPRARFLVAGKEAGVSQQLLKNQAEALKISDSVQFLGHAPSGEEFINQCSIGVISSVGSEEISRVCLEWMASGKPVVGTLVGSLPELIEPNETGFLVPPGDGAALSTALLKLLKDSDLRKRFGQNGRDIVVRKYSPTSQLSQTLEVYERVLARARGRN